MQSGKTFGQDARMGDGFFNPANPVNTVNRPSGSLKELPTADLRLKLENGSKNRKSGNQAGGWRVRFSGAGGSGGLWTDRAFRFRQL